MSAGSDNAKNLKAGEVDWRYRAILEQSPFSTILFAMDGQALMVNEANTRLWGVRPGLAVTYNILADAQLEALGFGDLVRAAFRGERVSLPEVEYDLSATLGEGLHKFVQGDFYPLRGEAGELLNIVLVHQDVTERHLARAAAQEREAALRAIIDAAPYSIVIHSTRDRHYLDANRHFLRMMGLTSLSELEGREPKDLVPMMDPEDLRRMDEEVSRTGFLDNYLYDMRLPDGSVGHEMVTVRPLEYRGEAARVAIVIDVTRLRRAEDELRRLNAELEEKVADRTKDLTAAMHGLEEAQERILVVEKLAALGRVAAGVSHELNTPLAAIAASNRLELSALGEGLDRYAEAYSRLSAGARAFVASARLGLESEGHRLAGLDSRSERRTRREALALLESARVADAAFVAEELVELGLGGRAAEALPFLSGTGSRDFLAALRAVLAPMRAARVTEEAVAKATRVVSALRTYVAGQSAEQPVAQPLREALVAVAAAWEARAGNGLVLRVEVDAAHRVLARRDELDRVFLNLVGNAVQAVGSHGSVTLSSRREGGDILVSVLDDGPGIAEAAKPRIFEPFFTTKVAGEGMGLGLDIARRLARANGGDIDFESRPGRTEFRVRLPSAD